MKDINKVTITGSLTRAPEMHATRTGAALASLRIACSDQHQEPDGSVIQATGYYNVTAIGVVAEHCERHGARGARVTIDARLQYHELSDPDTATKGETVSILAEQVIFDQRQVAPASATGTRQALLPAAPPPDRSSATQPSSQAVVTDTSSATSNSSLHERAVSPDPPASASERDLPY